MPDDEAAGVAESENPADPPDELTVRATVVDRVRFGLELVTTIVTLALPAGAVGETLNVMVLLLDVDCVLKRAMTPSGRPSAFRLDAAREAARGLHGEGRVPGRASVDG